jgi:hypothetical protein
MQRTVAGIASALLTLVVLACAAIAEDAAVSEQDATFHPQLVWHSVTIDNLSGKPIEDIALKGTNLAPDASAAVKISYLHGEGLVDMEANELPEAGQMGSEILSYVLWAVNGKGETVEIGELQRDGKRSWLLAPTKLREFGLLVTAEPYSQVARPSALVVLDSSRPASGKTTDVEAKKLDIQLLAGAYRPAGYKFEPIALDASSGAMAEELEMRNARRIALLAQADKYAPTALTRAEELYGYYQSVAKGGAKARKQAQDIAKVAASEFDTARALSLEKQAKIKQ